MVNPTPVSLLRKMLAYISFSGNPRPLHMQASYVKLPTCGIGVGEEGVADGGVCCIDGEEGVSDEVSEPAADPAGHEPDQRAPREPSRAGLQV